MGEVISFLPLWLRNYAFGSPPGRVLNWGRVFYLGGSFIPTAAQDELM